MGVTSALRQESATVTVAVCGNPNCGKTTIFNAITGLRQRVANYPGVTVEKTSGTFRVPSSPDREFTLIDIPGTYSLAAFSPDEYIAAQALFGGIDGERAPDIIVCVVDATNLERSLYLLFQVMQIGRPVVVALNMVDIAHKHGVRIDHSRLSQELHGIPVAPVVASRGKGISELIDKIGSQADSAPMVGPGYYDPATEMILTSLMEPERNAPQHGHRHRHRHGRHGGDGCRHRSRAEYLRVLFDVSGPAERAFLLDSEDGMRSMLEKARHEIASRLGSLSIAETGSLTSKAAAISRNVVTTSAERRKTTSAKIDRLLLHPVLGPMLLILIMGFMFQSIFAWAEPVMNLIDDVFGGVSTYVGSLLSDGPLRSLLTDGVIGGVGSVLAFLPQIVILFLFIGLLEDSGYMPRIAFLVDRAFSWCGLSGKSFIPMLSSYACAVPGIMATRTIEDKKLRFMTILVAPLMTCSARLPVYAIMIAAFIPHKVYLGFLNSHGLVLGGLYLLGLVVAVLVSLILKHTLLKTQRGTFMMEFPSYKVPTLSSVLIRVYHRARSFVVRAGTVILAITIIVWALSYYPRSEAIQRDYARQVSVISSDQSIHDAVRSAKLAEAERERAGAQLRESYLGQLGRTVEPLFRPLGWDWRITMATLASFPAREVIIATLGTIFNLGSEAGESSGSLVDKMRLATWDHGPQIGKPLFSPAVALSIVVFFALCCQCGATLVTIRQETRSWKYAAGTFVYMTVLAYFGAMAVYQIFTRFGGV
ncbi:MAG: ferrous iron transport protein B [Candidatus Zixiibacteriota bacterium]